MGLGRLLGLAWLKGTYATTQKWWALKRAQWRRCCRAPWLSIAFSQEQWLERTCVEKPFCFFCPYLLQEVYQTPLLRLSPMPIVTQLTFKLFCRTRYLNLRLLEKVSKKHHGSIEINQRFDSSNCYDQMVSTQRTQLHQYLTIQLLVQQKKVWGVEGWEKIAVKKLVTGLNQRRELVNKANLPPHANFEFLKCCFEPGIIELPLWIVRSLSQLHSGIDPWVGRFSSELLATHWAN